MITGVSSAEKGLRLVFMDELMERARNSDATGVSEVIYDMVAAGIRPGPRSFHGLVVSHVLAGDDQGAVSLIPSRPSRLLSLWLCVCISVRVLRYFPFLN